jgi:glycosyltransferase involved in cell wall biosynthesis
MGPVAKPEVSILLPVWNARGTLSVALESIRRQRHCHWECVVVDDGSTDGSLETARRMAEHDQRFRVLAEPHRGLVASLSIGLADCRAPLVARMDADDWMHRDRLALQRNALALSPELSAVGCHVRIFPRRTLRDGRRAYEQWLNGLRDAHDIHRDRFIECPVAHPTLMFRRERLCALGYRDTDGPEDYDLLLRLLAEGACVGTVPRRLHGWRDDAGRLSRTDPRYSLERFTACRADHLSGSFLAGGGGRDFVLWGHGPTGRALRRALLDRGHRLAAIVEVHPRRLGKTIHGAPVIPPEALLSHAREKIVVSVAGATPRGEIRAWLRQHGFREGHDFVCAA